MSLKPGRQCRICNTETPKSPPVLCVDAPLRQQFFSLCGLNTQFRPNPRGCKNSVMIDAVGVVFKFIVVLFPGNGAFLLFPVSPTSRHLRVNNDFLWKKIHGHITIVFLVHQAHAR